MFARHHQLGNRGKDRMSRLIALIVFLVLAGGPAQAQSGAVISWRVENPFRLFTDPGMTEVHRQVFEGLTDAERIEPVLSAERRLMELYPEGWAKSMYEATCWRPDGNRYGPCAADDDYINPESHEVVATLAGLASPVGTCTWQVRPFGSDRSKARVVSAPCAGTVSLDIPYPGGARVTALVNGNPMATTDMVVRDIFVAGIGDSFASGEGNPDRPAEFSSERTISYGAAPDGTPLDGYPARVGDWQDVGDSVFLENGTRWLSQACHRSLYSYQTRVALQLAIEDPHRAVTYVTFACAGAEVTFGLMVRYKGTEWAPDQPDKPQISAVARAQCGELQAPEKNYQFTYSLNGLLPELDNIVLATCPRDKARRLDLLLMSIGGNDVGFARVLANAILANQGTLRSLGGWMGATQSADDMIGLLPQMQLRYKALNRAIHGHLLVPWNESARIILTAYPLLAYDEGGVCSDGNAGMTVFPEFTLNGQKAAAGEKAAARLNSVMRTNAKTYGWSFVEKHREEFRGHGVCAGSLAQPINLGDDLRLPRFIEGAWVPYNPAHFQAYASRKRWYRTPNDAFLTGNYHIASAILKQVMKLQDIEYFQLVLAGTYSGAFHPTSEGHAVMADATVRVARTVLKRYEKRAEGGVIQQRKLGR